jgi:predicted dinucleotide-binding enzyme
MWTSATNLVAIHIVFRDEPCCMDPIAILGSGAVGSALARGWVDTHDVIVGTRTPEDEAVQTYASEIGARVANQQAAAAEAAVVVLAVPGSVVVDLAASLADELADTVVIDPTNTLPRPELGESLAEQIAEAAPAAVVVKAFNTVGANVMSEPEIDGRRATMLVCGDVPAVDAASELAAELGFEPVVAGGLNTAIYLEDLARLWIHLSGTYGRDIAFDLLGV